MKAETIQRFFAMNEGVFRKKDIPAIQNSLKKVSENNADKLNFFRYKRKNTALLYAIFLSFFGIDMFYCKKYFIGAIKLFIFFVMFFVFYDKWTNGILYNFIPYYYVDFIIYICFSLLIFANIISLFIIVPFVKKTNFDLFLVNIAHCI